MLPGMGQAVNTVTQALTMPLNVLLQLPQQVSNSLINGGQDVAKGAQAAAQGDARSLLERTAKGIQSVLNAPLEAMKGGSQQMPRSAFGPAASIPTPADVLPRFATGTTGVPPVGPMSEARARGGQQWSPLAPLQMGSEYVGSGKIKTAIF